MAARYTRSEEKESKNDLTKDNNTSEATNYKTPANDQVKIVRQKKSCCAVMWKEKSTPLNVTGHVTSCSSHHLYKFAPALVPV